MTINCKGQLIDLSIPKIMGILNLTPDSFYDGGKYVNMSDNMVCLEENDGNKKVPICIMNSGGDISYKTRFFV